MSRESLTRWTCNACGVKRETPSMKQPSGWVGYGFTNAGVPLGEQTTLGHLCDNCAARIVAPLAAAPSPTTPTEDGQS